MQVRKGAHPRWAPIIPGPEPLSLISSLYFRSATSWLAYCHWAAEGEHSTTKWKRLKVHKEEKRPCILAHTATVIMTSPDDDLYTWATDNSISIEHVRLNLVLFSNCVNAFKQTQLCVITVHSAQWPEWKELCGCTCVLNSAQVRWLTSQIVHLQRVNLLFHLKTPNFFVFKFLFMMSRPRSPVKRDAGVLLNNGVTQPHSVPAFPALSNPFVPLKVIVISADLSQKPGWKNKLLHRKLTFSAPSHRLPAHHSLH